MPLHSRQGGHGSPQQGGGVMPLQKKVGWTVSKSPVHSLLLMPALSWAWTGADGPAKSLPTGWEAIRRPCFWVPRPKDKAQAQDWSEQCDFSFYCHLLGQWQPSSPSHLCNPAPTKQDWPGRLCVFLGHLKKIPWFLVWGDGHPIARPLQAHVLPLPALVGHWI